MKIRVPRPQLQEPDKTSCNWNIAHFGNAVGFERDIDGVLKAVRAEYNLSTESKEASNRSRFKDDSHRFLNFPVSILRREISCASAV
ncbi:hypothetical protein NOV72_05406 [Caballeronia novacaledonica]|uniref:Uncharacterized protein n=1 Tax=Caballeronia novacaledonica TaxID=1544861 RepID=A0A2U3IDB2_9BURK|nr:hypothetical protein NOV72_05406 [Caballeronia novacaledonica]